MKILITGSNGLLGQKLVTLIASHKDHEAIATARGENRLTPGNYTYASMDISNARQVMEVIQEHRPDVIIHGAAMTNVDQCEQEREACWELNVVATGNIIAACTAHGVRLVHVSTDFIFDGTEGPLDENVEASPVNYYGESKLAAENLVMDSPIEWSIARTVLVYGIAQDMSRSNIVLWVKNSLEQGKEINVVNDQWRTPTLAEDLAMGCFLMATKKARGVYNISGYEMLTPYDMAHTTAEFFNLDTALIHKTDSTKFTQPARRPLKTGFVIDKARKDLGYSPKSFKEGVELLAEQMR